MTSRRLVPALALLAIAAGLVAWWRARDGAVGVSGPGPRGTSSASPSPSATTTTLPEASGLPVHKTKAGVIVREMLEGIVQNLLSKGPQNHLKAFYDRIRALGPDALPALMAILEGTDSPEFKTAAINAMSGLRAMARNVPRLVAEGKSPAEIAKQLDVPEETVRKWMAAGPWKPEATAAMVGAAWSVYESPASVEFRKNAISAFYTLGEESPAAVERLLDIARGSTDVALRNEALMFATHRLSGGDAAPIARIALDESRGLDFRLKSGLSYLEATKQQEAPAERDRLRDALYGQAEAAMRNPAETPERRGLAVEFVGRMSGADGHPLMRTLLRQERDDAVRCAAIKVLMETKGIDGARAELEAAAADPQNSATKVLAKRILQTMPK